MPDLIQFDCPSCTAILRVPIEMSGHQAPCPICHSEIIAPNAYTGVGASLPRPAAAPVRAPEPETAPRSIPTATELFPTPAARSPFADAPASSVRVIESKAAAAREPLPSYRKMDPPQSTPTFDPIPEAAPATISARRSIIPTILVLFLIVLIVGAGAAFFFRDSLLPPAPAPFQMPKSAPAKIDPAPQKTAPATETPPPSLPIPETPKVETPVPKPPAAEPVKAVAAAEATLRAFLEAPDWTSRSAYVLSPDKIGPKMEAYAKNNSDAATPFESFAVKHSQIDEDTKSTLLIFEVTSASYPAGLPVAVLETSKGWLVDWESFVEFRDDHFKHFTEGPSDLLGDFHVEVSAPPENSENDNFAAFVLSPPLPDRKKVAFVRKTNPAFAQLRVATANGSTFPVLEITKRTVLDGRRSYLEILSIKATDWRPRED